MAECRSEVVTFALGGTSPQVFLRMGQAERNAALASLVGREIRCVVGGNGAATGAAVSIDSSDSCDSDMAGRVGLRVERIASTNPAADLAHVLSLL